MRIRMGPSLFVLTKRKIGAAFGCLVVLLFLGTQARAEHGDWLLGTDGLLSGQQAPQGFYYSNIWSYYNASGSHFVETGPLKCGPRGQVCLSLNLSVNGSLDLFVDQNIFVWTSKAASATCTWNQSI
jgi:hypothetical protein